MFGSDGVLEAEYGGQVLIRGKQFYRGGQTPTIYEQGAVSNIAAFHDAIQRRDYRNATVAESVRSNLVTILGRTAAYRGGVVTWDELLSSGERLEAGPDRSEGLNGVTRRVRERPEDQRDCRLALHLMLGLKDGAPLLVRIDGHAALDAHPDSGFRLL